MTSKIRACIVMVVVGFFWCLLAHEHIVYVLPESDKHYDQQLFEDSILWQRVRTVLHQHGYVVKTPSKKYTKLSQEIFDQIDEIKYIIDLSSSNKFALECASRYPNKIVVFLWEPPVVMPHMYRHEWHSLLAKVFTWCDDLVDAKKFHKIYYPVFHKWNFDIETFRAISEQKKLCVLINANKKSSHPHELYSERKKVIEFFEELACDDFDLFGYGWAFEQYKNYQGTVLCPRECLRHYKFCICYENNRDIKGYVTEKIFNCFASGCVPIYWGASNITEYVPAGCFIDRRNFESTHDVYRYIKNMSKQEYCNYLECINEFFTGADALKFTADHLAECIIQGLLS